MEKRSQEVVIDINSMSVEQKLEPGKVLILVVDGVQGKAKVYEAVHHGRTIIETYNGRASGVLFDDREQF